MIAAYDSAKERVKPARSQGESDSEPLLNNPLGLPQSLGTVAASVQGWIKHHPTQAVIASAAAGILLGWLVKRRGN